MYIVLVASKTGTDMENKGKNDTLQATFYEYDRPFPKKRSRNISNLDYGGMIRICRFTERGKKGFFSVHLLHIVINVVAIFCLSMNHID